MVIKTAKNRKSFLIIFGAAILAITLFAVVGENGLIDAYRFKKERDRISLLNRTVEEENKRLADEINLLKTDRNYISRLARNDLGMVGKNEVVYRIEKAEDR